MSAAGVHEKEHDALVRRHSTVHRSRRTHTSHASAAHRTVTPRSVSRQSLNPTHRWHRRCTHPVEPFATATKEIVNEEVIMKAWVALAIAAFAATPASAQESTPQDPAGYVSGFGGAAWTGGNSTGSVLFEGGVRIAPHVMAFTNVGRFADLQADLQPTLDARRRHWPIKA
jgi:hypothetical protein